MIDFRSKIHNLSFKRAITNHGNPSLQSNITWTFIGNAFFAAAQWAMLVVLAKFSNTETVGIFALGLAITAPIILLSNLNLRVVIVTDARNENQFGEYLALRIATTIFALIMLAAVVLVSSYPPETILIIFMIGIAKAFDAISDILYGYMQRQERMDRIAISRLLQGSSQLASLGIVMLVTHNLFLATLAWAGASGAITFLYDIPSVRSINRKVNGERPHTNIHEKLIPIWNLKKMRNLILVSLPLGLAVMLVSLWTNIPRYFIEDYWGKSELGVFAALAALMMVGTTLLTSLGQPISPRLSKYHASEQYALFDRFTIGLVLFGTSVAIMGLLVSTLFGKQILSLVYTPEYAEHYDLLILLMLVSGVKYCYGYLGTAIQAMREFRINLPILIVSCFIVLALSIFLIPEYGVHGAAGAMLVATIFEAIVFSIAFLMIRHHKRKPEKLMNEVIQKQA